MMTKVVLASLKYIVMLVWSVIALYYFVGFVGFGLSFWGKPEPATLIIIIAFFSTGFFNLVNCMGELPSFLVSLANVCAWLDARISKKPFVPVAPAGWMAGKKTSSPADSEKPTIIRV